MIVSVSSAIELLAKGMVVGIPTETVYGLAARIDNESALKKIFSTKERPFFDPLIVHIGELSQIDNIAEDIPPAALVLGQKFWPGPLTLILKKRESISTLITAGLPRVGVRMPKHSATLEILKSSGPLAAPSANKFGRTSPTCAEHVETEFAGEVAVVDGGPCDIGIESSVVLIEEDSSQISVSILRPGAVTPKEIQNALLPLGKNIHFVERPLKGIDTAPGQLANHYQPAQPLVLVEHGIAWSPELHDDINRFLNTDLNYPIKFWQFNESSGSDNVAVTARALYSEMREYGAIAESHGTYLFLTLPKNYLSNEWEALRDRLNKASSAQIKNMNGQISVLDKQK